MRKRGFPLFSFGIFLAFAAYLNAQSRCNVVSNSCLDLSATGGAVIQVPENTTRINRNGLSICLSPEGSRARPVDVVFVVDQSGSMAWNDSTYFAPRATALAANLLRNLSSMRVSPCPPPFPVCSSTPILDSVWPQYFDHHGNSAPALEGSFD